MTTENNQANRPKITLEITDSPEHADLAEMMRWVHKCFPDPISRDRVESEIYQMLVKNGRLKGS